MKNELVIGVWANTTESDAVAARFIASELQPKEPICEMAKIIRWAKDNLGLGKYQFVRVIPGILEIKESSDVQVTFK